MSALKGFTSRFNAIQSLFGGLQYGLEGLYQTLSRQGANKVAADVALQWVTQIGTGTVTAVYTDAKYATRILNITAHGLLAGQVLRFTSGANSGVEIGVEKVLDANHVLVSGQLPGTPAAADAYSSFRYITPTVDANGNVSPAVSVGMSFELDGVTTDVAEDTSDFLASLGLPVSQIPCRAYASDTIDTSTLGGAASDTQVVPARGNKKLKFANNSGTVVQVYIGASVVMLIAPGESGQIDFGANPAEVIGYGSAAPDVGPLYVTYFN